MSMLSNFSYSIAEDEFILNSLKVLSYDEIATVLERRPAAIRIRSYRLLRRTVIHEGSKNRYSLEERALICELHLYHGKSLKSLGERFGCTHNTIKRIVDKTKPYKGNNPFTIIIKSKV